MINISFKKVLAGVLSVSLAFSLTACSDRRQAPTESRGISGGDKTVIRVMYPRELAEFFNLVESTYSDIEIQFIQTSTATMESENLRQLKAGKGMDLIFTTLSDSEVTEYMLDLSAYPFSTRYASSAMSNAKLDGKTILLPLPSQSYGYIINKTLVERLGAKLPETLDEFLDVLRLAQTEGVGSGGEGMSFGIFNLDRTQIGLMVMGQAVPDRLATVEGEQWLRGFSEKKATLSGFMDNLYDTLYTLTYEGLIDPSRMDYSRNVVNSLPRMAEGTMLAAFGSTLDLQLLRNSTDAYEFTMIPLLSEEGNHPWIISIPVSYIGINRSLSQAGSETKLDACLRILDLLSTQEGQSALSLDLDTNTSLLADYVQTAPAKETGLEEITDKGYVYYLNRIPSSTMWKIGDAGIQIATGKKACKEAIAEVDAYHANGASMASEDRTIIGGVSKDLVYLDYNSRKGETALGNLVADSVAELSGADIALVNGGGIRASLYEGDVYRSDLYAVCPYDNTIIVLEMTGRALIDALKNGISAIYMSKAIPGGRFLQVHGICYTYTLDTGVETADTPAATELVSVTLSNGTPVMPEETYTVAVNSYMCGRAGYADGSGDGFTMLNVLSPDTAPLADGAILIEDTGKTYADALETYFANHAGEAVTAQPEGRITVKAVN